MSVYTELTPVEAVDGLAIHADLGVGSPVKP
jgi:hypothetical protein